MQKAIHNAATGEVVIEPFNAEDDAALAAAQALVKPAKWEAIKAHRDALQEGGCQVGADWFHNDVKSRGQWERMVNRVEKDALADVDAYLIAGQPVQWKTMTGAFVALTAGKIRQAVAAMEVREAVIFTVAEQHRAAMLASADPASYDFSAGWPATFQA